MTHLKLSNRPAVRYTNFIDDLMAFPGIWPETTKRLMSPAANVVETPSTYLLELNVPGRKKEDFKISTDKGLLTISYEKDADSRDEKVTEIRKEFTFNNFKRSFTLDEKIDVTAIAARYDNGILKIELPKKEEVKGESREITIS